VKFTDIKAPDPAMPRALAATLKDDPLAP